MQPDRVLFIVECNIAHKSEYSFYGICCGIDSSQEFGMTGGWDVLNSEF